MWYSIAMNYEVGDSIKLPDFSGSEAQILMQLLELANQGVDNQVWYTIERQGGVAGSIVTDLLDSHM